MSNTQNTPGFNKRMTFRFSTDKNNRKRAHYWSPSCTRWMPAKVADATMFVEMGVADKFQKTT